jgi:hypothetical protein
MYGIPVQVDPAAYEKERQEAVDQSRPRKTKERFGLFSEDLAVKIPGGGHACSAA